MSAARTFTPVKLRIALAIILILIAAIGVGIFMLGYHSITMYSKETQQTAQEKLTSQSKVNVLKAVQATLKKNEDIVLRASQLVSKSEYYVYQDQIIQDINSYASYAGVGLDSITFTDSSVATATPSASSATASSAIAASGVPAGIRVTTATVNITNPTNYTKYLRFLHALEQSVFRMSVLNVGMTKATDTKDPDAVTCDPINIEVYIKS